MKTPKLFLLGGGLFAAVSFSSCTVVTPPVAVGVRPVAVAPAPVIVAPRPVVVAPRPIVRVAPGPVRVGVGPVVVGPRPVVAPRRVWRSDERLKTDVRKLGESPSGIAIYSFKYKDSEGTYQGVMAQEVPWATSAGDDGFLLVDYSKVDVEFIKLD